MSVAAKVSTMIGPGKYDQYATLVREATNAQGVVVIVFEGDQGNGFSVQATSPSFGLRLAGILELVVAELRKHPHGHDG
jgi:hypothetical protein